VLAVTRLSKEKDPLTLAQAVVEFARRTDRRVTLTLVGRGPLREPLEERLRMAQVPLEIIDHVDQVQLAEEYRSADVHLSTPHLAEGWTQAALEAMACGVPVIGTDVPGLRDCVGGAGILVPPRDVAAIAGALQTLLLDDGQWVAARNRGLDRASNFTWDAVATRLRAIYTDVLASKSH
jgi:glycosyltransferase involved in cell wall biosynthesis